MTKANNNLDSWKTVTLILTERCNLKCSYCYEANKSKRSMPLNIAKRIIDNEFLEDDSSQGIIFDLFGGEPFIEFNKLVKIVEYIEGSERSKPYLIFATTNGTLVHDEVKNWLKTHKNFICGLSLDGTKYMHDLNRSNSFDRIDLDFFANMYPEQPIKMTISQETLPFLYEGVVFCHKKGFKVSCNLAFGIDWSLKDNVKILETELNKLIDFYLQNPTIEPCSMLNMDISFAGYGNFGETARKWCGTGIHMHTYDTTGEKFPCQFFTPLSAGKEKSVLSKSLEFYEEIPNELLDEKCINCVAKNICPTCYGSNYLSTGNLYSKEDNYCLLTKIQIRARSFFKARQWEKGLINLTKEEEYFLLKAIVNIQKNLN